MNSPSKSTAGDPRHPITSNPPVLIRWNIKIPLRDGVHLSGTLYLPSDCGAQAPAIVTLTPYIAQTYHDRGMYFAAGGYPFLAVDVRGRGNSEGVFWPFIKDAQDGFDVIEWLAKQPYCDGQVAMWGGSYAGFAQWSAAKEFPPHLRAIVPAASPYFGVDFPSRSNVPSPYLMQWLTLVWGRTAQDQLFWNREQYWGGVFRQWFESGAPFQELDEQLGNPSGIFKEWLQHPHPDAYWDNFNPTAEQYARLSIPVLTITGIYDANQLGALTHYRQHLISAGSLTRARHYLVIGPWDHAGTRTPQAEFCGLKVGSASLMDLPNLHREWYAWTMQGGPKPSFLKKNVAYYLMGAETWCYSETLEAITARSEMLYLGSKGNPIDVFQSGVLSMELSVKSEPDLYLYDPRDVSLAELESTVDPEDRTDHRMIYASPGRSLIYHSTPFDRETEISGFFKLSVWLAIDQPDTDFWAAVYEITLDGSAIQLTFDCLRARYRDSQRQQTLVSTKAPLRYDFEQFTFVSRQIAKGSRLRLVFGPVHSIYSEKNYNSGGVVSEESLRDARSVTVRLFHDESHPSALHVPIGQSGGDAPGIARAQT